MVTEAEILRKRRERDLRPVRGRMPSGISKRVMKTTAPRPRWENGPQRFSMLLWRAVERVGSEIGEPNWHPYLQDHPGGSKTEEGWPAWVLEPYERSQDGRVLLVAQRVALWLGIHARVLDAAQSWHNPDDTIRIEFFECEHWRDNGEWCEGCLPLIAIQDRADLWRQQRIRPLDPNSPVLR